MIEIDGKIGEGGGQILRTSLTLASITKKSFIIRNIRVNRKNPGLQNQHLAAVLAAKTLTNAKVKGDIIGSTELIFEPQDIVEEGNFIFKIGTAGSVTLVLQTILPLMINRKINVTIQGGIDVPNAPTIDSVSYTHLTLPTILRV